MALLSRSRPTAVTIETTTAQLNRNLSAAKDELKAAKEKRDALPFDTSKDVAEQANATVRQIEDSIVAMTGQINEGGKQLAATRAEEFLEEQPILWAAMRKELLDMDDHARAICDGALRLTEMQLKFRDKQKILHQVGKGDLSLSRPMQEAISRYRAIAGMSQQNHSQQQAEDIDQLNAFSQFMQITAGPKYSESVVARIMNVVRVMTVDDVGKNKKMFVISRKGA